MTQAILQDVVNGVATVTLNRPEKLNALNREMWLTLAETMGRLSADEDLRCVVITGAGKAFAAGADISEFQSVRANVEQGMAYGKIEHEGVMAVADCQHPVIAAIRGPCVGGGLEIAAACDLRICTASSRFGVPINRLGLTMALDEMDQFVRAIGRAATVQLLLEGSIIDAARAAELGVVHHVVDDQDFDHAKDQLIARVTGGAPLVNRWHKKFLRRLQDTTPLTVEERREGYLAFGTRDFQRGYQAFLEKRTPRFSGQ